MPDETALTVDLKALREEQRVVTGIHEAYGQVYRDLGFDRLLSASRYRASAPVLFHTVMARIANPHSKRETVRRLGRDFGVAVPLEKVYRMMDRLDGAFIERLRARVAAATEALLPEPVNVLFFDCSTLYFESVAEDVADRPRAVRRLLKRLKKSAQPRSLLGHGAARYVRLKGQARWELDPGKIAQAARWDGLHGVVTNLRGVPAAELFERYRGLWQVEASSASPNTT